MKRLQCVVQMAGQDTPADEAAFATPDHFAMRLHGCDYIANPNLICWSRESDASTTSPGRVDETRMGEIVGNLHEMASRNSLVFRDFSDGRTLLTDVREADQQSECQIGMTCELHCASCLDSKNLSLFDANQMHLQAGPLSGI